VDLLVKTAKVLVDIVTRWNGQCEPQVEGTFAFVVVADAGVAVDKGGNIIDSVLCDARGHEQTRIPQSFAVVDR
jgi:hypothetical protein